MTGNNPDAWCASLPAYPLLIMELGFFGDATYSSDSSALGLLLGSTPKTCSIFPKPFLSFPSESPVPMFVSFISSSRRKVLYFFSIAGRGMTNIYLGNPKFSFCLCHTGQMCLLPHEANGKSSPGRNKSSYFIVTWEK